MKKTVGAYEAKTHLSELLERVSRGERISITRRGAEVARLVPPPGRSRAEPQEVVAELRRFRRGRTLGRANLRRMIEEGRRF